MIPPLMQEWSNHTIWMVPVGLILTTILAMGVGLMMAPINAVSQDVSLLFKFIVRAGFFVSPVMWTYEMLIDRAGSDSIYFDIAMLNPVVIPLTCMRHSIEGTVPSFEQIHLIYAIIFPLISYIIGSIVFTKYSRGVVTRL